MAKKSESTLIRNEDRRDRIRRFFEREGFGLTYSKLATAFQNSGYCLDEDHTYFADLGCLSECRAALETKDRHGLPYTILTSPDGAGERHPVQLTLALCEDVAETFAQHLRGTARNARADRILFNYGQQRFGKRFLKAVKNLGISDEILEHENSLAQFAGEDINEIDDA